MAFDAIQICFGELNMKAEEHIMKAVQQVDVNVDKEKLLEAIKAKDFVDELIGYIFAYPDDDYMTMECLCRKLFKYGLIDKVDGYYQTHEIRTDTHECVKDTHDKTENSSEKPNNSTISKMEQVGTMSCQECKHWNVYKGCRERVCKYEPKDEPQTERSE